MDKTNGRDAARRLLGAGSDLVKAARSTDSALGVNTESFDKGQYQAYRKGGKVTPKKTVIQSYKEQKDNTSAPVKGDKGTTALPKGMARVKTDKKLNGQQNEPELIAKKACGGKMIKRAAGGAAKLRKKVMTKDGKANPNAC